MTAGPDGREEYEVIVVGGGPAGTTCATLLAQRGRRVLLLEASRFPRFHIGESFMPESYWPLQRLGMIEKLKASRFPRKHSVQFIGASGRPSRPFYFSQTNPHESSVTWQVVRAEFDEMMLANAVEHGVEAHQGTHVSDVQFDNGRAVTVKATGAEGTDTRIRARVVVDATGQGTLLARKLDLKQPDLRLRKSSVFAHYSGAHRDSGVDEGATVILHTPDGQGWFWYIPLPDDRVSVGVVASPKDLLARRGGDPGAALEQEIAACPAVRERLASATRATDVRVARDFSYVASRCAGDGWVLIGDAMGFIDPIYSSGVFLALKSGEFAAETIDEGLRTGNLSGERLGRFRGKLVQGIRAIRNLVYAFYTEGFSFAKFLREHPEQRDNLVAVLVGDVFRDEVHQIFEPMGKMCELPAEENLTA